MNSQPRQIAAISCCRLRLAFWARWISILLTHAALLVPLAAAGEPQNDLTELNLEDLRKVQVSSASMYLQSDREAPSSVTVITADQIRKFGYRTLADILRGVRGFYVSYDRNYSYVGVRGFSRPGDYNDRIQVLLNGHRLTDNLYNSALIGTEFQLDVDLIDRVEIVRGPSSSLYGTSAFFAVINVITKTARSIRGAELSGEVDGFGTYKGRSTYGETRHGVDMVFSGTVYESAGPGRLFFPAFNSPATDYGFAHHADDDAYKSYFGNIKFRHFTLEAVGSTREKGIPTASFGTVFDDPRTRTIDSRGYLDLQYDRTFKRDLEWTTRISYDRVAYHGTYIYNSPGSATDVVNEDFGRGDWLAIKNRITKPLWRKHKVTAGVDFRDNLRQDQSNYNLNPLLLSLDDQRDSKEWAVYVQDEFSITKGLILNAGVRHDYYESFGGTTNPRAALIYSPFKRTTFKFLYGRAFRAPNNYELYYHDGFSQKANPFLRPEKIQTAELVWEQDLGANFRVTADGFEDHITGLIDQQTDRNEGFLVFQNSQKVSSRGLELELAGKTANGVEGRISYTLQRTRDSITNLSLSNSPAQMAKVNVIWPMVRRNLFVGLEAQYMDARKILTDAEVGAFALANLTVTSREFAGGFRLSGSVYNLFDRKYSDPVGVEFLQPALQQNGRDFRIKITRVFRFAR